MVTKRAQQQTAFAFGLIFIVVLLGLAITVPNPTDFQYAVFRIVLALAAAGVAAMLPGFLTVDVPPGVRAGGALAVFVIVYFFSPAQLITADAQPNGPSERAAIPGNTGWVLLGYFDATDSSFDATGPHFEFIRRRRDEGPYVPSRGDMISLTKARRLMIKQFMPNRSTKQALALICADYDENRDDTGIRLPAGTELVVRDVGDGCQDTSQPGNQAALWVRVAYPPQ